MDIIDITFNDFIGEIPDSEKLFCSTTLRKFSNTFKHLFCKIKHLHEKLEETPLVELKKLATSVLLYRRSDKKPTLIIELLVQYLVHKNITMDIMTSNLWEEAFTKPIIEAKIIYLQCLIKQNLSITECDNKNTDDLATARHKRKFITEKNEKCIKKLQEKLELFDFTELPEEFLCSVCLLEPKSHVGEKCGHFSVCSKCVVMMKEEQNNYVYKCPICRTSGPVLRVKY